MCAKRKNTYTAKERRGILGVAIVALIVTGAGFFLRFCGNRSAEPSAIEQPIKDSLERTDDGGIILHRGDNATKNIKSSESKKKEKDKKKKRSGRRKSSGSNKPIIRDPLSDTIPRK